MTTSRGADEWGAGSSPPSGTRNGHAPEGAGARPDEARAELRRLYASPEWRWVRRWRRLRVEAGVWRYRLLHPADTARHVAAKRLPIDVRLSLVRAVRKVRPSTRAAGAVRRPVSRPATSPAVVARARPTIICLPAIEWSFRKQRPQHLLERLATRGWEVLYSGLTFQVGGREATVGEPVAPGVRPLTLPAARELSPGLELPERDDLKLMVAALKELAVRQHLNEVVVLCHSPFWGPLALVLGKVWGWKVVYDRMDLHSGFSTTAPGLADIEKALIRNADLVVATSEPLERGARELREDVVLIPNGCDWEVWGSIPPGRAETGLPRPVIGYFGAISDWFDTELVSEMAIARPAWSFVLAGSTWGADVARLQQLPNVHLPGELPYEELSGLAVTFDVGIIPFRRGPLTEATDPVKLYEMLALGLDVVATPLPSLEPHRGLVRLAGDAEGFLAAVEAYLGSPTPAEVVAHRRELARRSSWESRADRFEAAVEGLYPRVTIGIVTFNNRELTELCLESVLRSTEYPSYEILFVDNLSTDGTREFLQQLTSKIPALRVVLNDANRGFAAGCNQAFQEGTGEIFCFLNNDTVVTRGWLSSMVSALQAAPRVGMVGPSSNGVANDTRVQPGYADLGGLESWASEYVASHRGESCAVPMLALYCAALRREVWEEVGELDESFATGMFEDDDYSTRLRRAGYELRCVRDAYVHHWQQASFGALPEAEYARIYEENRRKYLEKVRRSPKADPVEEGPGGAGSRSTTGRPARDAEPLVYDSGVDNGSVSAMIGEVVRYKDLLRLLVGTNLKTRYKRSILGVAWTLLNPLLTMIVMTIAFSALFRFSLPNYPVYVLTGLTFWTFFQQSTMQAMSNLIWGSSLLKKVHVPASVFPLSAVGTGIVNLFLSLVPILIIMVALKQQFTWALCFLPVAVLLVAVFALGLGFIVSSLAVFFSDVVEMFGVLLRVWFYLTPVMYPEKIVPERYLWLVKINPLHHFMLCWREPIYRGVLPPTHSVLICAGWALGILLIGSWVFARQEHQFALRA